MRRALLWTLAMGVFLGGCAAERLTNRGDAALLAGQAAEAVDYYEQALGKDADLANEPEFRQNLRQARIQAAYDKATAAGDRGDWDGAMASFPEVLAIDPNHPQASAGLASAKRQASKVHHGRALKYADQGQLNRAIAELKQALQLDPSNRDALDALDSVTRKRQAEQSRSEAAYVKALALIDPKRWGQAEQAFQAVVAIDRNHLPARAKLHQAREKLRQARQIYASGAALLAQKRLDRAIETLAAAVDIWPFHPKAGADLTQARTLRQQAEDRYLAATKLAAQSHWDETVASTAAALEIFPFHADAIALHQQARQNAAQAHFRKGEGLLAGGKLVAAEAEYLRCFDFVPRFAPARGGLARLYTRRGAAAEGKQRWGSALLWYRDAAAQADSSELRGKVQDMRERIHARAVFTLGAVVRDTRGRGVAAAVSQSLVGSLAHNSPSFLNIAAGREQANGADYLAELEIVELSVSQSLDRSEDRVYEYSVERDVPNPELPRLRGLLATARVRLHRLRAEYSRKCSVCGGDGKVKCKACGGKGYTVRRPRRRPAAPAKGGKGTGKGKGKGKGKPRKPPAPQRVKCQHCQAGRQTCRACGGTGNPSRVTHTDLVRQTQRVTQLRAEIAREPKLVRRTFRAQWPYAIDHFTKTGRMAGRLALSESDGSEYEPVSVDRTVTYRDSTVRNANLRIGLRRDPLSLPSDAQVRSELASNIGSQAAGRILSDVLQIRRATLQARSRGLAVLGSAAGAREIAVDAALVVEPMDPGAANADLASLADQQRQAARAAGD